MRAGRHPGFRPYARRPADEADRAVLRSSGWPICRPHRTGAEAAYELPRGCRGWWSPATSRPMDVGCSYRPDGPPQCLVAGAIPANGFGAAGVGARSRPAAVPPHWHPLSSTAPNSVPSRAMWLRSGSGNSHDSWPQQDLHLHLAAPNSVAHGAELLASALCPLPTGDQPGFRGFVFRGVRPKALALAGLQAELLETEAADRHASGTATSWTA